MKLGTKTVTGMKLGTVNISRAYLGSTLVWEAGSDPEPEEFGIAAVTTAGHNPSVTSHTVALPSGSGGLLVVFAKNASNAAWQAAAGWTLHTLVGTTSGQLAAYVREADATEPTTLTFTTNVGTGSALIAVRISGAALDETTYIEVASSTGNTMDPPSLAPSWGAAENLWIAVGGTRRGDANITAAPAGYSGFTEVHSPNASSSTNEASLAIGFRLLTAASENPGAFTRTNANGGMALTVAIRPAAT